MKHGFLEDSIEFLHKYIISKRRTRVLTKHFVKFLPRNENLTVLDVGCGSGEIGAGLAKAYHNVRITGIDKIIRDRVAIDAIEFDGERIPFKDKSYDFAILVHVLHHTDCPGKLLKECMRVSRRFVIIADHVCNSWRDNLRLRFMDWAGNRGYNASLPYRYLSKSDWERLYQMLGVIPETEIFKLGLYPMPFSFLFDGRLHFIARIKISANS